MKTYGKYFIFCCLFLRGFAYFQDKSEWDVNMSGIFLAALVCVPALYLLLLGNTCSAPQRQQLNLQTLRFSCHFPGRPDSVGLGAGHCRQERKCERPLFHIKTLWHLDTFHRPDAFVIRIER